VNDVGVSIYALMEELFPICRSITGDGVRETLKIIQSELGDLKIHEVPTGIKAFDWEVPREWNIRDAYIIDPDGKKIVDFQESNLHVVGYSLPVDNNITLDELQEHLHSLPGQPDAIPYITSYYQERWGFCLPHSQRERLKPGTYEVRIDSDLEPGSLTYGELILPGENPKEIFLSTYICHPSMANNELSGPTVVTHIAKWLHSMPRRFTYRIIFIPETIGSIVYLSRNLDEMKGRMIAGFNITCVGDDLNYSYLASRYGDTLSDQVAKHVLGHLHPGFKCYSYLERGSDERQYCSPGVDLPIVSIMRTKYGAYPEYHTSLDNLEFVSPEGLGGAYDVIRTCIECLEANETLKVTVKCEPQLGKRGLYPTLSTKESAAIVRNMMNLIAYSDGSNSLLDIAEWIGVPMWDLIPTAESLKAEGLLESVGIHESQV
jgi:aminopeptidase-like protein